MSNLERFKVNLNDFTLIPVIGSGKLQESYKVRHNATDNIYIAEITNTHLENANEVINHMINILIDLNHPAIIKYLGYSLHDFEGEDNVTLIRDYAKNGNLSKILCDVRRGIDVPNFDNTSKQIILVGVAHALMYLHRNNIVFRDVKPFNILLDENFRPYLHDFKIAAFYDDVQEFYKCCGTPSYMSPETINKYIYNEKTDVYSFGMTMFEIVTGQVLYPQNNTNATLLMKKVAMDNLRPEFTTPIKPEIQDLIKMCWSKYSAERPTFERLFNLLAYGKEDSKFDIFNEESLNYTDKYYLDGVDVERVRSYADQLRSSRIDINMNQQELAQKVIYLEKEKKKQDLEINILTMRLENIESQLIKLQKE